MHCAEETYVVLRDDILVSRVDSRDKNKPGFLTLDGLNSIKDFESALIVDLFGALWASFASCSSGEDDHTRLGLLEELGELGRRLVF